MSEPLSDDELAQLERYADMDWDSPEANEATAAAIDAFPRLLAEVRRLQEERAKVVRLESELALYRGFGSPYDIEHARSEHEALVKRFQAVCTDRHKLAGELHDQQLRAHALEGSVKVSDSEVEIARLGEAVKELSRFIRTVAIPGMRCDGEIELGEKLLRMYGKETT